MGGDAGSHHVTDDQNNYGIGFDLGGTILKCVAVDQRGTVLHQAHFATLDGGLASSPCQNPPWAEKVCELLESVEQRMNARAAWVGVAAPGLASADHRSIAHMPGRLEGLEGLDWTRLLERDNPVLVLNDAHAALLGECWRGAGRGLRNAILLTLGTGVGGAILCEGQLLRGQIGRAGHVGHITLNPRGLPDVTGMPGSLEDLIGECSIRQRTGGRFRTTRELIQAHLEGNLVATEMWLHAVYSLACALGSLINVMDPEAIILGGGIAQSGDALFEPLRQYLAEVEWRPGGQTVRLIPAQLGEFAGALGAARYALENVGLGG
ncbi:MAG: ROK family protein [Candidatus Hydrogenedentes bacterium]|nr:ROK family protein [Candidatus Hydrogenedentota bacterium]